MKKREFYIVIEREEDGALIGSVPGLKGAHSYGCDFAELTGHMKEVIELCLEELEEQGETGEVEFVGIHTIEV